MSELKMRMKTKYFQHTILISWHFPGPFQDIGCNWEINVRFCQIEYLITDDAGRVCAPPISIFLLVGDGENICMHCLDSIFSSGSETSEISTHHELELPTVGRWEN